MTDIPENPTLTMREVLSATGCGRSTIYLMMDQGRFPRPYSLPKKKVRWRRTDIENWLTAARQPPPESEAKRQARLDKLARAPRAGQKRRAPQHVQSAQICSPYAATPIDHADRKRLMDRLGIREDGEPIYDPVRPLRWHI